VWSLCSLRSLYLKKSKDLIAGSAEFHRAGQIALAVLLALAASRGFGQNELCQDANRLFQDHQWSQAAEAFQKCEATGPGKTDAFLYRGKALVNLGEFTAAASSLESYLASHPRSDDALYLLGYVRFRQDHPKESLDAFARAARLKGPQASDLKIAALDYVLLNDYISAARYLEQSLQMDPTDIEARYHLGRVRYQQNQFDAAIAAFKEVLGRNPQDVKAEENLGLCLEAKNQNEAAIAAYRKAIELDLSSPSRTEQPYLDLGKLLTTLNRAEEAIPVLSQAVAINPQSAPARYELGRAQFAAGHSEKACMQLEESVRLDPQNSGTHYLLGRVYKRMGRNGDAAAQFKLTEQLIRQHNRESGGMASGR
jgi:tetratricopeptide (TPR) repeat protein